MRSAMMELFPCAMLANGPAWTKTGVPSSVCISVGCTASRIRTASAPAAPMSSAVTGSPSPVAPTTMAPMRRRMSARSVVRARIAMISLATVMSNPVVRVNPNSSGPCPTVISRSTRSLVSITRRHVMVSGSIPRRTKRLRSSGVIRSGSLVAMPSFSLRTCMPRAKKRRPLRTGKRRSKRSSSLCRDSCSIRMSIAAASRLLAAVMAWMSPVRCRLKSSMGITWL